MSDFFQSLLETKPEKTTAEKIGGALAVIIADLGVCLSLGWYFGWRWSVISLFVIWRINCWVDD